MEPNDPIDLTADQLWQVRGTDQAILARHQVPLGDCATLVRDTISPGQVDDATPYVGLEHIVKQKMIAYDHGIAKDVSSAKFSFRQGDILFGKLRPYFRKAVRASFDGICSTDIWVIRTSDPGRIDQGFLFYCMIQRSFMDFAALGSEGTRMPRAKWDHVSRYLVTLPTLADQRVIATAIECMDHKINGNIREIELLIQMRNLVTEKLLAGVHRQDP